MEPENDDFQKESSFPGTCFQVNNFKFQGVAVQPLKKLWSVVSLKRVKFGFVSFNFESRKAAPSFDSLQTMAGVDDLENI